MTADRMPIGTLVFRQQQRNVLHVLSSCLRESGLTGWSLVMLSEVGHCTETTMAKRSVKLWLKNCQSMG